MASREAVSITIAGANPVELPSRFEDLDPGSQRFVNWRAKRVGLSPQAYLDDARAARAAEAKTRALVDEAVVSVRARR
ncbi:hypothetical protein J7E29_02445 [Streptomyces sp. ISL-90]|nr:hypothetical protein [Streptomyces sp. ISL-90]